MIRVHKPSLVPAILTGRGSQETKALLAAFDQARDDYLRGTRTFEDFKGDVYAHASVKETLRLAQHEKCAFCESHFRHVGYGDGACLPPLERQTPLDRDVKDGNG